MVMEGIVKYFYLITFLLLLIAGCPVRAATCLEIQSSIATATEYGCVKSMSILKQNKLLKKMTKKQVKQLKELCREEGLKVGQQSVQCTPGDEE